MNECTAAVAATWTWTWNLTRMKVDIDAIPEKKEGSGFT